MLSEKTKCGVRPALASKLVEQHDLGLAPKPAAVSAQLEASQTDHELIL